MNVYKIEFHNKDPEVVTARSHENATDRLVSGEVDSVRDCGPYLSDGAYQALRNELL